MQSSSVKNGTVLQPGTGIALVIVALREVIAKARQQVLKLRWPDGDLLSHRDLDAFADEEIKRIVTRGLAVRRRPTLVMALLATGRAFSCVTMLCNAR